MRMLFELDHPVYPDELRTPEEWSHLMDIRVLDPDGWRFDGKPFDEPVTYDEFILRTWTSTIEGRYRERK